MTAQQKSLRVVTRSVVKLGVIILTAIFFTFPYLWMIGSAFRPRDEIFNFINPISWKTFIPQQPTLEHFRFLFVEQNFTRALGNSLLVAFITVLLSLLVNSLIAFALARLRFPGRKVLFTLVLSTMLIPFEAIMVSMFIVIQRLGLFDTYAAILLPWITDAFIIFLLRQHFLEIPRELQDAAIIDGCSYLQVYWHIMLPNIKPALISAAFIKFVYSWDAYIWPLIVTRDPRKMVIQVAIARLFTDQNVRWGLVFAGSFIGTIPLILLFLYLQRYYIEGVVTSGLKG